MAAEILERILADTRRRLAASPPDRRALERAASERPAPPDPWTALRAPGPRIIAEVKRRSPSAGALRGEADPVAIARGYEEAGAAAISVLTEPEHFGGSLEDLRQVADAVRIPCLRKDFVVDEVQLLEARAAGAALVLLIVAALDDAALARLHRAAEDLGLAALVEAHTADEVRRAVDAGARIVGVNNRDLRSFEIDLGVSERLRPLIPDEVIAVAESGIRARPDLERLAAAGYDVFLVGSGLMAAPDPPAALRALLGGGP
ncbi:MAG: indole-3-glycerol phosphate synthase TrpC [Myxococcota bacterium]